jgi:hypothetical protein
MWAEPRDGVYEFPQMPVSVQVSIRAAACRRSVWHAPFSHLITCALRAHLIEPSGLSTRRSSDFRTNARALLMPSFAEGYGYPVAEPFVAM